VKLSDLLDKATMEKLMLIKKHFPDAKIIEHRNGEKVYELRSK